MGGKRESLKALQPKDQIIPKQVIRVCYASVPGRSILAQPSMKLESVECSHTTSKTIVLADFPSNEKRTRKTQENIQHQRAPATSTFPYKASFVKFGALGGSTLFRLL